ncbi:MAG TPA: phosphatase PAP2 family protein [Candidatus Binatia bacterium]|nr:phosphatase PAP2 family protein [Candidatus Binatia bacterium]
MRITCLFQRKANSAIYLLWFIPYVLIYQVTNRFPVFEPRELHYTALDAAIPFLPALLPIYLMYFPLFWWTAVRSESDATLTRFVLASHLQLFLCCIVFVLFPVRMPQGMFYGASSLGWADTFWRWFDGPNNCLPSLHAANGLLFLQFNWNRPRRALHTAAALGVVLSTVFVKQHYVVDIVAGAGVYALAALFLSRLEIAPARPSWLEGRKSQTRAPEHGEPMSA